MMNEAILKDILNQFHRNQRINQIKYYRNIVNNSEIKIIAKIEFEQGTGAVIRLLSEPRLTREQVELRCRYQAFLGENGFAVPEQYSCGDGYCLVYYLDHCETMITLERYVESLPGGAISMSGHSQLCAELNHIAGKFTDGSFDAPNGVLARIISLSNFIPQERLENDQLDVTYQIILRTIMKMETEVKKNLGVLPKGFVHGDLSTDNLPITLESKICIIDFNVSGIDLLIGSMILNGCRLIYTECLHEHCFDLEKITKRWREYVSGYERFRTVSPEERACFNALMGLVVFTIYIRYHGLNVTIQMTDIEKHFDTIIRILNYDYEEKTFER